MAAPNTISIDKLVRLIGTAVLYEGRATSTPILISFPLPPATPPTS
jgi:hypothetical protein